MLLSEVKETSAVLSVHGRSPESRAVILCLVYTRQSKGIACASSNSNLSGVVGLVGETTLSILILSSVVIPRRGRLLLTTQSRVGEYDCGWNHAAADYLRCSKGTCTHLDASDLISLLDVLLT